MNIMFKVHSQRPDRERFNTNTADALDRPHPDGVDILEDDTIVRVRTRNVPKGLTPMLRKTNRLDESTLLGINPTWERGQGTLLDGDFHSYLVQYGSQDNFFSPKRVQILWDDRRLTLELV
ncbi:hypothetical protein GUJ93_ZPchr0005g15647 [Zizania palustris]|uniref:Uncharacterized protein n=1 Tax=Zizania palustris TaxID=103762 RepID=A0A8J5T9I7_ZIZPA|nr:hypothetical protein GUJ93_ZPchr0005g15647 [Zizania palustris]